MKNIKLYKVEWIEGYDNDIEHDVTYEKILSWFEDDTKVKDSLRIASSEYVLARGYPQRILHFCIVLEP